MTSPISTVFLNVLDYGAHFDGTDDSQYIQDAVNAAATLPAGGWVMLPMGKTSVSKPIAVPASVRITGTGQQATQITSTCSGDTFVFGNDGSTLAYGCAIQNVAIFLTEPTATAIHAIGCAGFQARELYIEGPVYPQSDPRFAARTNIGIAIDGGDASSFFNNVESVICNHLHIGYKSYSTGTQHSTTSTFLNCSSFGDRSSGDTGSIGFSFTKTPATQQSIGNGEGSPIVGGNAEQCGVGLQIEGGGIAAYSLRFEGNATDVVFTSTSGNNTVRDSSTLQTVLDEGANNDAELTTDRDPQSWSPTLQPQTAGSISLDTTNTKVWYSRHLKLVTVWGKLVVASVSAPSGNLLLEGLPFSVDADPSQAAPVLLYLSGVSTSAPTMGYCNPNATNIVLQKLVNGSAVGLADDITGSTVIQFRASYVAQN